MKALAGTVCALLAAGCMAPGPLVSQSPTSRHQPFAGMAPAATLAWSPPPGGREPVPTVALPAELFAPVTAAAPAATPVRLASLSTARVGLVETALVVPASSGPAEQGPRLIPTTAAEADEPGATGAAAQPMLTASAEAVTIVEDPSAADHIERAPDVLAFQQPGPAIAQPGPTFAPGRQPGGPAVIAPGAPIIMPDNGMPLHGGMPLPGGPCGSCNTCPPGIGAAGPNPCGAGPGGGGCLFSSCGLFNGCGIFAGFELFGGLIPCGGCGPCAGAAPQGGISPAGVYGGIDPLGMCDPCGIPCGGVTPRAGFTVFGEFIYLTARGADVAFATPSDGLGGNAVPIGNTLVADPDYDPGYRVGGSFAISPRTSFLLMYTDYESSVEDSGSRQGGNGFLRATLVHPNTITVAADQDFLSAAAQYDIDFEFGDLALSHDLWRDCESRLTGIAGFRYAHLDQELLATYSIPGFTAVKSDLEFEGFGPRLGLDAERFLRPRLSVYGNAFVNFLAGTFDGSYDQQNLAGAQVSAGFEDDRIVTLLEAEMGIAYRPPCGWWRASVGYYVAGWFNVVTTSEFIQAVQADDFHDVDDTLTFDGLTARLQLEF